MEITLRLDEGDIADFRAGLAHARALARTMDECDAVDAAKASLDNLPIAEAPGYVRRQLVRVQRLIAMLEDEDFALPQPARGEVVAALVYLSDPDDLIPDGRAVVGLVDDAIMIELVMREIAPILTAYDAFGVERREAEASQSADRIAFARRLAAIRDRLHAGLREA